MNFAGVPSYKLIVDVYIFLIAIAAVCSVYLPWTIIDRFKPASKTSTILLIILVLVGVPAITVVLNLLLFKIVLSTILASVYNDGFGELIVGVYTVFISLPITIVTSVIAYIKTRNKH